MPTIALNRTQSAYTQKATPTKPSKSNPATLTVNDNATKTMYVYEGFGIPTEVLGSTAVITGATLVLFNDAVWAGAHTLSVRRATTTWSGATVTWAKPPTIDPTVVSLSKTAPAAKTRWEFNVLGLVQSMQADGGKNFGFQVRINDTAGTWKISNAGAYVAVLILEYYIGPAKPTSLSPANSQVVSVPKPILRITGVDGSGIQQNALRVQVDAGQDGVTPDYDSLTIDTTSSQVDLANLPIGTPAFTAMTDGAANAWRVQRRGIGNIWSPWSDWAPFSYRTLGSLAILEPPAAPDNVVTDPTPPTSWALTGRTQKQYRLIYTDPSLPPGQDGIFDTGIVTDDDDTATPTTDVAKVTGHLYRETLRIWDTYDRVTNGGVPEYVEAVRDFVFVLTNSVAPVLNFDVEDLDPYPFAKLTWSRSEPPDGFQIVRDGISVGVFDASDLHVSGDYYAWVDQLADPRREHTWYVRVIVNGETSSINTGITKELNPAGIWLSHIERDRYLPFITQASQAIGLTEQGATYQVLNGRYGVRITGTLGSWSGTIVGEILATELSGDTTGANLRDMFLAMREDTGSPMILSLLDMSIKVVAFNMSIAPTPTLGRNGDYVYQAQLEFIEVP